MPQLREFHVTTLTNLTIWAKFKTRSYWQGKAVIGLEFDKKKLYVRKLKKIFDDHYTIWPDVPSMAPMVQCHAVAVKEMSSDDQTIPLRAAISLLFTAQQDPHLYDATHHWKSFIRLNQKYCMVYMIINNKVRNHFWWPNTFGLIREFLSLSEMPYFHNRGPLRTLAKLFLSSKMSEKKNFST